MFQTFFGCRILDLSFNRIRKIQNIGHLKQLKKLFLCANKITKIENLEELEGLELLELGDNKIRVMTNGEFRFIYFTQLLGEYRELYTEITYDDFRRLKTSRN